MTRVPGQQRAPTQARTVPKQTPVTKYPPPSRERRIRAAPRRLTLMLTLPRTNPRVPRRPRSRRWMMLRRPCLATRRHPHRPRTARELQTKSHPPPNWRNCPKRRQSRLPCPHRPSCCNSSGPIAPCATSTTASGESRRYRFRQVSRCTDCRCGNRPITVTFTIRGACVATGPSG